MSKKREEGGLLFHTAGLTAKDKENPALLKLDVTKFGLFDVSVLGKSRTNEFSRQMPW